MHVLVIRLQVSTSQCGITSLPQVSHVASYTDIFHLCAPLFLAPRSLSLAGGLWPRWIRDHKGTDGTFALHRWGTGPPFPPVRIPLIWQLGTRCIGYRTFGPICKNVWQHCSHPICWGISSHAHGQSRVIMGQHCYCAQHLLSLLENLLACFGSGSLLTFSQKIIVWLQKSG